MNETNVISVIIPTYNRGHIIQRAIYSVLKQTFPHFELIVVDDGSKDDTAQVVSNIAQNDKRVYYIYQNNQGAQVARNKGLSLAKGQYISFLDSDDEWRPTFLSKMLEKFRSDPSVGCVYCHMGIMDGSGTVHTIPVDKFNLKGSIYREALEQGYVTLPSSMSMRRSCFDETGGWDVAFSACQDDDMCFRLAKKFSFALIPEVLCIVHTDYDGSENRIGASKTRVANAWWQLWNKYENDVLQHCGRHTMGRHYLKCAARFADAGDDSMREKAISRAMDFHDFKAECDLFLDRLPEKKLYCYGIGKYAGNIARYLLGNGRKIEAFIVSDAHGVDNLFFDVPVIGASGLEGKKDLSVLIATSEKHYDSIKNTLAEYGIEMPYTLSDDLYEYMCLNVAQEGVDA